ncbi:MAG: TIGR04348 family glycosyltransferase [Polaromonas sp.]|nr:TIGR04348 family glycosyltransferase [Polaromonas sp.]
MVSSSDTSKVVIVSPALREANNGNWHTAQRWARFLSGQHQTTLLDDWPGPGAAAAGIMVALHARRSAPSIQAWARQNPDKPLVLVLTGTDLYRDIQSDADARLSLALASHLVVLQENGLEALPPALRARTRVIYQSARPLQPARKPRRAFRAVMVGHLRDEKDPLTYLRAAAAAYPTPMHFEQIGAALQPELAQAAQAAAQSVAGYRWLGNLPRATARQHIKRAHVLVNSSLMEGGAQVIIEAVQSGTAVLASAVSGNIGMLGADYQGYFPAGDDAALAALLQRCATQPAVLARLEQQCRARAHLFSPDLEKRLVINLVNSALKASP